MSTFRRRSTITMGKSTDKPPVVVNTTEFSPGLVDEEKVMVKKGFFQRRRNRVFIGITGVLVVILIILIPLIHKFYLEPREQNTALPSSGPSSTGPSAFTQPTGDPSTYAVVKANFPDPCLIEVDGGFYAFATRSLANTTLNIQAASAPHNISEWTLLEGYDALPVLPSWVKSKGDSGVWAPQVVKRLDGTFLMYFAALHEQYPRKHCIGTATSPNVLGPYTPDDSAEPLVCHFILGGIIDPTFLEDPLSNKSLLIYKNDGNSIGSGGACANSKWPNTPTTFQYDIMEPDTYSTFLDTGKNTRLNVTAMNQRPQLNATSNLLEDIDSSTIFLHNARSDGPNIEGPQAWYQEYPANNSSTDAQPKRAYHLLYNSGCFADVSYRINHLVCWIDDNIKSFTDCPWAELKEKSEYQLLRTGSYPQPGNNPAATLYAPGGPGVTLDGRYMAFHADINLDWFNHTHSATNSGYNRTDVATNGTNATTISGTAYTRQRALFIAELQEVNASSADTNPGLSIRRLILPTS